MKRWVDLVRLAEKLALSSRARSASTQETKKMVFGKYLIVTNTVASSVLFLVGDLVQQEIEYVRLREHKDSFDWQRTSHMGLVGLVQGPVLHHFYRILDEKLPGTALKTIGKKVAMDQTLVSPFCITTFFLIINFMEGKTFSEGQQELRDKFLTVYAADCMWWIPAQFINFYLIKPKYRVTYVNLVTMCYNVFLSFVKYTWKPSA